MSKHISDLNEAKASRTAKSAQADKLHPQRPRLAERLVALAPLAQTPTVLNTGPEGANDGLSRLTRHQSPGQQNAIVPLRPPSLPRASEPVRLSLVGMSPPVPYDPEGNFAQAQDARKSLTGFVAGLAVAAVTGIALYAILA